MKLDNLPRTERIRPDWTQTWLDVAHTVARRSWCIRRQAGVAIVDKDNRIVATGYNGPPAGLDKPFAPCIAWCARATTGGQSNSYDDCVSVHAEVNALIYADRSRIEGGTLYVTSVPCFSCAKAVANSGVARVVCRIGPEDALREPEKSLAFMQACGLDVTIIP